eukprot:GHVT01105026.1.p1 GENE.GHVT01105026.1~~GHVT01105026.1.p1  ORF type:complete len:289 (-),score=30.51 GHVT01105026.1:469-1335(-)
MARPEYFKLHNIKPSAMTTHELAFGQKTIRLPQMFRKLPFTKLDILRLHPLRKMGVDRTLVPDWAKEHLHPNATEEKRRGPGTVIVPIHSPADVKEAGGGPATIQPNSRSSTPSTRPTSATGARSNVPGKEFDKVEQSGTSLVTSVPTQRQVARLEEKVVALSDELEKCRKDFEQSLLDNEADCIERNFYHSKLVMLESLCNQYKTEGNDMVPIEQIVAILYAKDDDPGNSEEIASKGQIPAVGDDTDMHEGVGGAELHERHPVSDLSNFVAADSASETHDASDIPVQ